MFTDAIKWHWEDTCIKNVEFKVIKIRKGCRYVGYFYYSENLNWAAQNLRLGRGLDIADLDKNDKNNKLQAISSKFLSAAKSLENLDSGNFTDWGRIFLWWHRCTQQSNESFLTYLYFQDLLLRPAEDALTGTSGSVNIGIAQPFQLSGTGLSLSVRSLKFRTHFFCRKRKKFPVFRAFLQAGQFFQEVPAWKW